MHSKFLGGSLALVFSLLMTALPNDSLAQREADTSIKIKSGSASSARPSKHKRGKSGKRRRGAEGQRAANRGQRSETSGPRPITTPATYEPATTIPAANAISTEPAAPGPSANATATFYIDAPGDTSPGRDEQAVEHANLWNTIRPNTFTNAHYFCLRDWDLCRIETLEEPTKELKDYYVGLIEALDRARLTENNLEYSIDSLSEPKSRDSVDSLTDLCILVGDAYRCLVNLPEKLDLLWGLQRDLQNVRIMIAGLEEEIKKLVEVLDELPEKELVQCLKSFRGCEFEAWRAETDENGNPKPPQKVAG
jgi:hypothetical protein